MLQQKRLAFTLIWITALLIFTQVLLLIANVATTNFLDTAVSTSLTWDILTSRIFIVGVLGYLCSQIIMYAVAISLIWYFTKNTSAFLKLNSIKQYWLGIFLLLDFALAVLMANTLFVPFSFFSTLIKTTVFNNHLNRFHYFLIFNVSATVFGLSIFATLLNFLQQKKLFRHDKIFLGFIFGIMAICTYDYFAAQPQVVASSSQPNVILIGIDALRPDFVSFYNPQRTATPNIDNFLETSISFANTLVTLPRTFPSWASILTASYPLHNHARGNNTDLSIIDTTATLPKSFQQAGYETIYGTDDTRFNNTNEMFGFDHIITPPMGLNDFLIGTINDFPLANLIIPTPIGRILFPYNYANHGTPMTYLGHNFLQLLNESLHRRQAKPLFLAVHFTVTHWPFYWFNSHQPLDNCYDLCRYSAGINQADLQFAEFMQTLKANGILEHAIVVLLSDHGTGMGLPGDRPITEAHYQGRDKNNIYKIPFFKSAQELNPSAPPKLMLNTSYGYGGDVLSLVQYHALLSFKGYGVDIGVPHAVSQRVFLMDIGPTLLDVLHLPKLTHADGISLKPFLLQEKILPTAQRKFFLESSFTLEEIEQEGISVTKVLAKTVKLYRLDNQSGLIFIKTAAEKSLSRNKQIAIIQGDWMLAHYPKAEKTTLKLDTTKVLAFDHVIQPPFLVLVNLATGQWTLELDSPFAATAPVAALKSQLLSFYQSEFTL